jgi:hypothetical protein
MVVPKTRLVAMLTDKRGGALPVGGNASLLEAATARETPLAPGGPSLAPEGRSPSLASCW